MSFTDFLLDPFDTMAGWLQGNLLLPMLWHLGLSAWEDISYGWALIALYGIAQVFITLALSMPAERFWPLERWSKTESVGTDILYTWSTASACCPWSASCCSIWCRRASTAS